jgi:tetratricopeptide (TPR) repeat protein
VKARWAKNDAILMTSPSDWQALSKEARRCFRKGEYQKAIELFEQALDINPEELQLHDGIATAYFLANHCEQAAEHFARITELRPSDGKAYINLGAVYNRMGEFEKAAQVLRKGLRFERKSCEGYYNLGIAHRQLNQLSMAVNAYREAVRLNPQFAEAHQNLANVYLDMGTYKQAIQHYNQALKINPDFQRAQRGLKKAEQVMLDAKKSTSPFGRLVNEDAYVKESVQKPLGRTLSYGERVADRKALESLTAAILDSASQLRDNLRNELVPTLVALNRTVTQNYGGARSPSLYEQHERFQQAAKRYGVLRKQLKAQVQEFQQHENSVASG